MLNSVSVHWERRDLLIQLVVSKLKLGKKDMALGYLWWVLDSLLLMGIYWVLVSVILQRGGPDYPLFILCGIVPFRALSVTASQSVTSVSSKFSLISQINFPRIYLPLSDVLANHVKLFVSFIVVLCAALFFSIVPGPHTLLLVVPFLIQVVMAAGIAMIFAITGVFLQDLKNIMQFVLRVWLYGSPVLYSIELVPESWRYLFWLNPMTPIIIMYRDVFMYGRLPQLEHLAIASLEAVILVVLGYALFARYEGRVLKAL